MGPEYWGVGDIIGFYRNIIKTDQQSIKPKNDEIEQPMKSV